MLAFVSALSEDGFQAQIPSGTEKERNAQGPQRLRHIGFQWAAGRCEGIVDVENHRASVGSWFSIGMIYDGHV